MRWYGPCRPAASATHRRRRSTATSIAIVPTGLEPAIPTATKRQPHDSAVLAGGDQADAQGAIGWTLLLYRRRSHATVVTAPGVKQPRRSCLNAGRMQEGRPRADDCIHPRPARRPAIGLATEQKPVDVLLANSRCIAKRRSRPAFALAQARGPGTASLLPVSGRGSLNADDWPHRDFPTWVIAATSGSPRPAFRRLLRTLRDALERAPVGPGPEPIS